MIGQQLEIPLFSPDLMEKVKAGHRLMEMEKMRAEIEHLKHQRAGHIGAFRKLKKEVNDQDEKAGQNI